MQGLAGPNGADGAISGRACGTLRMRGGEQRRQMPAEGQTDEVNLLDRDKVEHRDRRHILVRSVGFDRAGTPGPAGAATIDHHHPVARRSACTCGA